MQAAGLFKKPVQEQGGFSYDNSRQLGASLGFLFSIHYLRFVTAPDEWSSAASGVKRGAHKEVFSPFIFRSAELVFQPEKTILSMKIFRGLLFVLFCTSSPVFADTLINARTNPASGNWEDLKWSLGIRPGSGQSSLSKGQLLSTESL